MNKVLRVTSVLLLVSLFIAVPPLQAFWIEDGNPVCTTPEYQHSPEIAYGGAGHALIAWLDERGSDWDIYIQRLDETGSTEWKENGEAICAATGDQEYHQLISDGGRGAIVVWQDERGSDIDIYAQRVDESGDTQWLANGVAICTAVGDQEYPQIASDGLDGAIIAWIDHRIADHTIFTQRIGPTGKIQWAADGIQVCSPAISKSHMQIIADGSGGAIIAWREDRGDPSLYDIYAQRIDASGTPVWTAIGGVVVCTASRTQNDLRMIPDGAGGAVIAWRDDRAGSGAIQDIYAQRINYMGTSLWTPNGVLVCTEYFDKSVPSIASDGSGGAIITWGERRDGDTSYDVYAQHVSHLGTLQWGLGGLNVTPIEDGQGNPQIASDGAGGAIIVWEDLRGTSPSSIYTQKIDGMGTPQLITGGIPLCLAAEDRDYLRITEDGTGGAIVTWADYRTGVNADIYAQWIDAGGMPGYRPTIIGSVGDIPGDEGGWVRLSILKHSYDDETWFRYPIYMYNVWRRVDDPAMLAAVEKEAFEREAGATFIDPVPDRSPGETDLSDWPIIEMDGGRFLVSAELLPVQEFPPGTWEVLGSFNAFRQDEYLYVASTPSDSTSAGIPMPVFVVSAHTLNPSLWYVSAPDSGYSVDNLAPAAPLSLTGEQSFSPEGLQLDWDDNSESDLTGYRVYRGTTSDFAPSQTNLVGAPAGSELFDGDWTWDAGYWYKVAAVDRHGNESPLAVTGPDMVTGDDPMPVPDATFLAQNFPNPFNPSTTIAFGLKSGGFVNLSVYDAAGRLVATLINESRPAGQYAAVWNGKDLNGSSAASGIYFYRLDAGDFMQTKKMVLLR